MTAPEALVLAGFEIFVAAGGEAAEATLFSGVRPTMALVWARRIRTGDGEAEGRVRGAKVNSGWDRAAVVREVAHCGPGERVPAYRCRKVAPE